MLIPFIVEYSAYKNIEYNDYIYFPILIFVISSLFEFYLKTGEFLREREG